MPIREFASEDLWNMSFFNRFYCTNFKNFIRNSKIKLENNLSGLDLINVFRSVNPSEISNNERILLNLDTMTQEEKIVWMKISANIFQGVLLENCTFANYKIIIERELFKHRDIYNFNITKPQERYTIRFIKGELEFEKLEYICELFSGKVDIMCRLMSCIEKRVIQQNN